MVEWLLLYDLRGDSFYREQPICGQQAGTGIAGAGRRNEDRPQEDQAADFGVASSGDNITPPQQALNWVVKV